MTKFLLVIVLLVTGVKFIDVHYAFIDKHSFSKLAVEEEGKQEKREQGKSKYENEDKISPHSGLSISISNKSSKVKKITEKQDVYSAFVDKPNTPPPDMA